MANALQIELDERTVTYGDADDVYPGKKFVSIGSFYDHTTFIVEPEHATIRAICARGVELDAWRKVAIAETFGYWD